MTVRPPALPSAFRRLTLAATLAVSVAASPSAALAQTPPVTIWDLFTLERMTTWFVQFGMMSLRSQVDLVYDGISVSPFTQAVTLTGFRAWPDVDWARQEECVVAFDRLVVRGAPIDDLDRIRLKLQATGGSASLACLPPEPRQMLSATGLTELRLARATFDLDYRVSSSAALVRLHALADDLAAVTLTADFDYLWFNARHSYENPEAVALLKSGRLEVENLGGWERVRPMLPPMVTDPALAGQVIARTLIEEMPVAGGMQPSPMRKVLAASATDAWAAFLAEPERLVLETGFDPAEPRALDFLAWELGPDVVLDDLEPRLALVPSSARAMLPVALLAQALEGGEGLTEAERLAVGMAFATGSGAPRDLTAARTLLGEAAGAGDGAAALALAQALATQDPEAAYGLALAAAAAGEAGAAGLLDRIEGALPLARVLALQEAAAGDQAPDPDALSRITRVRAAAAMRLTGSGMTRSYADAAYWALIGAAAGDGESADILAEIDELARRAGPEAMAAWGEKEAIAAARAREDWVGLNLPAALGAAH